MKKTSDYYAIEFLKCRQNPLYFIYNYVRIPEIGGSLALDKAHVHAKLKRTVRSIFHFNKVVLMASRQLGKALDIETEIPILNGKFKKLKDINVGDYVIDETNNPIRVIATTDIMQNRPCYEIRFSNGELVTVDENHLWKVFSNGVSKIITTKEIYNNFALYSVRSLNQHFYIDWVRITKSVPVKCIQVDSSTGMFLCTKSKIPTHNSTIAAAYITWALNFYAGIPIIILNMRQVAALENLNKIKFIHSQLPAWMRSPIKGRAERKTYLELENNSIVRTFYPASTTGPDQIARSLTAPILYIDEVSFIRHIDIAYRAAQPVLC